MTVPDVDQLTMTGAMRALRAGDLSAVELLQAVHARYLASEDRLHAWAERWEREALAHAMVADRRIRIANSPAPLLGIPLGIKDIFDVAGKATRCNSALRQDAPVAARDAEPVHRLRKAGAVLLGKTVTQEFAAGVISAPARNPWDVERVPGGSSGGSAVAIASGTALATIGSDTGGSIRIPASVTGTVGLKPTWGRVPLRGTFPLSPSLDTAGPIARTVADALALHLVLTDRPGEVTAAVERIERPLDGRPLAGRRIGVLGGYFTERVQPDVAHAFAVAARQLEDLGAEIIELTWEDAPAARAAALLISRVESAAVHHGALRDQPDRIGEEVRLRFEAGALLPGDVYLRARAARQAVSRSIAALYERHELDAVASPTTPATALLAVDPVARFDDGAVEPAGVAHTRFTMPWNATGQPVISLPCGFDGAGLPVGLSLVGRPNAEEALCLLAHAYEQATEWHLRRPPLGSEVVT